MKKQTATALYVLAASILISALALAWAIRSEPETDPAAESAAEKTELAEAYRLERVVEVAGMVLNRKIVPEDYFRYLDAELADSVRAYNSGTDEMRIFYTQYAEKNIQGLAAYYQDSGMELPLFCTNEELIWQAADHIAACALYREPYYLYSEDPVVYHILEQEGGSSGGLWLHAPHWEHNLGVLGATQAEVHQVEAYLDQVDALLDQLDAACGYVPPVQPDAENP